MRPTRSDDVVVDDIMSEGYMGEGSYEASPSVRNLDSNTFPEHPMTTKIECPLDLKLDALSYDEATLLTIEPEPAGLPVPNPSRAFWTHGEPDCNPLAREGSDGPLASDADVCIIGSGITGVSCAYHLAQLQGRHDHPLKIVILEARDFCQYA